MIKDLLITMLISGVITILLVMMFEAIKSRRDR